MALIPCVCPPGVECHSPAYLLGHVCLTSCPPRYFNATQQAVNTTSDPISVPALRVCAKCHPSCYTCRGSSPHNCTACPPASTLDARWGSCTKEVPPSTHPPPPPTTANAGPHSPAQAVLLALLAVALKSPLLSSRVLCRLAAAR